MTVSMIVMIATDVVSVFLLTETDQNVPKTTFFLAPNWDFFYLEIGKKGDFGLGMELNIRPW